MNLSLRLWIMTVISILYSILIHVDFLTWNRNSVIFFFVINLLETTDCSEQDSCKWKYVFGLKLLLLLTTKRVHVTRYTYAQSHCIFKTCSIHKHFSFIGMEIAKFGKKLAKKLEEEMGTYQGYCIFECHWQS